MRTIPSHQSPRLAAALIGLAVLVAAGAASAQVQSFRNPTYQGYAINYCGATEDSCGERVATTWCRSQGFEYASDWSAMPGLDATTATVRLDDGVICRGRECDAFGTITCGRETQSFRMPVLGAAGRATAFTPSQRTTQAAVDAVEFDVLIPGCHQRDPGVFLCESVHDYQHCRTLMQSGRVFSCRAGLAFDGGFVNPEMAEPGQYALEVDSSAEVRVEQGARGRGRVRGEVEAVVTFKPPAKEQGVWCLQRDRYVYYPTGPKGGISEIDDTDDCELPIQVSFAPHEDDLLQAYDLCATFDAWGGELEQPIDVLVAAIFHIGSASPKFLQQHGGSTAMLARYLTVKAPMRIECQE